METTKAAADGQLSGNVLFYSQPEPLSNETHGKLGLRRIDRPFAFAAGAQAVPLTVTEFPDGGAVLSDHLRGRSPPAAGGDGCHGRRLDMFLQPNGGFFEVGVYVPAYIRRYPFVLANDTTREQLVVCIDRAAPMLGDLPDLPFFDPAGQPTDYTKTCIQFCNDYETELRRTESFTALLQELDLLEVRKTTYTPQGPDGQPGPPQEIAEYFAVSEDRLKALPDDKVRLLLDNGAISQIYAHLTSLMGWDKLLAIAIARRNAVVSPANLN